MARVVKLGINRPVTRPLLPDPDPREVKYTFISVDDHLMEPKHTFEGRLPAKLQDRAPRVVETEEGHEIWMFEDTPYEEGVVSLGSGDALLVFSDGVTETWNPEDEEFGEERLAEIARSGADLSAAALQDAILGELETFARGGKSTDDRTLIVLRRA